MGGGERGREGREGGEREKALGQSDFLSSSEAA